MWLSSLQYLLAISVLAYAQDTNLTAVKEAFDSAHIPTDLGIAFNPRFLLEVSFPQAPGYITLHAGLPVPRNATVGPPSFTALGTAQTGPFVIISVDPDVPTPQNRTLAQIRHLLAPNFSALDSAPVFRLLTNSTPAISPYLQPGPPAGSPAHRYIFLLFDQPEGFNDQTLVTQTTPIALFNVSAFAAATGLGAPIAGTFMLVAPDASAA